MRFHEVTTQYEKGYPETFNTAYFYPTEDEANAQRDYARGQGLRARIHRRDVKAEGLRLSGYVLILRRD